MKNEIIQIVSECYNNNAHIGCNGMDCVNDEHFMDSISEKMEEYFSHKEEQRYFMWNDGDGHYYCVPIELQDKIKELDALDAGQLGYDAYITKWDAIFYEIEPQLIKFEKVLTFTDPKTK